MAFADIDYFGDGGGFDGKPAWSGRVTSAAELDRFDWGAGRKSPFASLMGGRSGGDMDRLIEDALKKRERKEKLRNPLGDRSMLKEFNRRDNKTGGAFVGITGGGDMKPNDMEFSVDGSTVNAQFPFASRIGYDPLTDELSQFLRMEGVSGMGRVVGIGAEQKIPITKMRRPGFYFSPERKDDKKLYITNCKVFLGCLSACVTCDDVEVEEDSNDTYYIHVDFSNEDDTPKLTVDTEEGDPVEEDQIAVDSTVFTMPICSFKDGAVERQFTGVVILPTFSIYYHQS